MLKEDLDAAELVRFLLTAPPKSDGGGRRTSAEAMVKGWTPKYSDPSWEAVAVTEDKVAAR